jgi:hypothetical protein
VIVPAEMPPTVPVVVDAFTVPTAVFVLDQVPPAVVSVRLVVKPTHTLLAPAITAGVWFTVIGKVAVQLPGVSVYIILTLPAVLPVTTPVPAPTEALPLLALHVPPVVASARVVVAPVQTVDAPVIAAGVTFTVNGAVI